MDRIEIICKGGIDVDIKVNGELTIQGKAITEVAPDIIKGYQGRYPDVIMNSPEEVRKDMDFQSRQIVVDAFAYIKDALNGR